MFSLCSFTDKKKIYDLNKLLSQQKKNSVLETPPQSSPSPPPPPPSPAQVQNHDVNTLEKRRENAEMINKMLPNFNFDEIEITRS